MKHRQSTYVIAPSSSPRFSEDEFKKWISEKSSELQMGQWNFRLPLWNQDIPFHSKSDEDRFLELRKAVTSGADWIWCLRGGYGSMRLLKSLNKLDCPKRLGVLVGISDVTPLHLHWNLVWKKPSLHASLLDRWILDILPKSSRSETLSVIQGQTKEVHFNIRALNSKAKKMKSLKSSVVGGNLTCVASLLGTPYQPKFSKHILFLEDTGERGYRVDRLLWQLKESKVLKGVVAVIFGSFTDGTEPDSSKSWISLAIDRFAQEVQIPVFDGVLSGHDREIRPLPFGTQAQIVGNQEVSLKEASLSHILSVASPSILTNRSQRIRNSRK